MHTPYARGCYSRIIPFGKRRQQMFQTRLDTLLGLPLRVVLK